MIIVDDFWKKVQSHSGYCIITIALPKERVREVPHLLRRLFHLPTFKTKGSRMGKVARLAPNRIEYYESDWQVQSLSWLD